MDIVNQEELTSEYINSLPVLTFKGPINKIKTANQLDELIDMLIEESSIGFDTESRPSFIKGRIYPISLVQLATPKAVYIVLFKYTSFTDSLLRLLESPVEKVGIGLKDDIKKLQKEREFKPNAMVDLSEIARSKGHVKSSLRALSAKYLRQRIVKSAQKTNWAKQSLTEAQLRYAATDAWACLLLRPFLEKNTH